MTIFLPKINSEFENDPLEERKKMPCRQAKCSMFSGRWPWSKTQNGDQNRIYPSLTLKTA